MSQKRIFQHPLAKIPLVGILLFLILFLHSSTLYPGGSQADANSVGYDWINNYWCNLMNEIAMNGESNPARPFAISGMIILCGSLFLFFNQFAAKMITSKPQKLIVKGCALGSMVSAALMFTEFHDILTMLSSLFGFVVIVAILRYLFLSDLKFYKITAILILALLAVNNYIYYTKQFIEVLPVLQKVSIGVVLFWIIGMNRVISLPKDVQSR